MLRIFNLLLNYWRPLYFITIAVVLIFQVFWLRDHFNYGKRQLIQQIEFSLKNQLVSLKLKKIAALGTTPSDSVRIPKIDSILKNVTELNTLDPSNTFIGNYYESIPMRVKKTTLPGVLQKLKNNEGYDSVLYYGLKKNIAALSDVPLLIVHQQSPGKITRFPKNTILHADQEPVLTYLVSNTNNYRIYIEPLKWIIFKSLWVQLLFSLLYVLLFLVTISVLLHAGRMNKKLMESKNNFTRNMTHELKIPISTLNVAVDSLNKYHNTAKDEDVSRYLNFMKHSIHQLTSIIDSILTNARMEEGKTEPQLASASILTPVREVIHDMSLQLKEKRGQIILNEPETDFPLYVDHLLMKNVFFNLFDNSIKYSNRDPLIRVSVKHVTGFTLIHVTDNGTGIPEEYINDVFQPYFRITHADVHDVKGYGLGLSYVKEIIHLHQGNIKIKKSNLNGTEIEISIPWIPEKK